MIAEDDEAASRAILARQSAAWAVGDAAAFGADAAEGVLFTNILGMFSIGRTQFDAQHAHIFATVYKDSRMDQEVAAITPLRSDVVIVDTIARVTGVPHGPPGIALIDGAIQTRLEQVLVKDNGAWRIAAFHNVAVGPAAAGNA